MTDIFELIKKIKDWNNGSIGIFSMVFYILLVIAMWNIFTKAREKGWKSLIPIYNYYILCKICGISFLGIVVLCITLFIPFLNILTGILLLIYLIMFDFRLSRSFGHGFIFFFGLIFFKPIFLLILGLGKSKYKRIYR
jgi:hypothetical protein